MRARLRLRSAIGGARNLQKPQATSYSGRALGARKAEADFSLTPSVRQPTGNPQGATSGDGRRPAFRKMGERFPVCSVADFDFQLGPDVQGTPLEAATAAKGLHKIVWMGQKAAARYSKLLC